MSTKKTISKIKNELLPIRDRILRALADLPENRRKPDRQPKAKGVHNSTIKRLVEETALPAAENMMKICKVTGLPADYFYFGTKPAPSDMILSEMPDFYDARLPAPVDVELIAQVVIHVENFLDQNRLKISGQRKGKLISMIYEYCATEKEKPTPEIIKAYLRLTH
jgi:hypothetical protein